ncbi:hypothetical protein TspCOW1_08370 [Thiohalobacter sp. COW1]|uniref:tellurite resistance TerB family protein n=1 Tax=Thiohalobacter sp. COW1 TaxID=2795687 RepID=UPI001915F074|nr:TerB family tellurite resistance protein [Thiohalobacter sp. COW1]BCO30734.1 hypothetical protein TspCOW1_08370 [Thiohalobacter sp. COW1]
MEQKDNNQWFHGIDTIIDEPLKFKARLSIGENAYASLRVKNKVIEIWDALGAASTGAAIAQSSAVASTFFAPSWFLSALGVGAAATPIGWVVAAGLFTGGAWVGISRYVKNNTSSRVTVIPQFINTPMDVLALALFDLIAPLALRVAIIDGEIDESEKISITNSFINDWGYNEEFVNEGLLFIESNISEFSIAELASSLAEYKKENPDCSYDDMSKEILHLLREVIEADGRLDEREDMAIERIERVFKEVNKLKFKSRIKSILEKLGTKKFHRARPDH